MENSVVMPSEEQPKLTHQEIVNLFVITLADVYTSKSCLMILLPSIVCKTTSNELKFTILNLGTIINGQRIRLRLAIMLLQKGAEPKDIIGNLDLDKFLHGHVGEKSIETDAIILTHLIVAEAIEIASFKLLSDLAVNLYPRTVAALMNLSLKEAIDSKRTLENLLTNSYLIPARCGA
ncbi:DUF892 family protein [Mucilaginibacter aquaedulcis]|uniref:DUF892 family protein n=1 Tax=Mucilaginibacter aquaedulcis TaxID=1187081 RepID=UPI0025B57DE3|nr:DUF892 family protein [Mucilaginibacter aquaedulcis]MDN3551241.1 DUF892 family protein [Mucilaginibacter aquaedulcis]